MSSAWQGKNSLRRQRGITSKVRLGRLETGKTTRLTRKRVKFGRVTQRDQVLDTIKGIIGCLNGTKLTKKYDK